MGALSAILSRSGPPDADDVRGMLSAARHYGGDCTVSSCGSCALGVVNGRDTTDSTLSHRGPWMAAFTGKLDNADDIAALATNRGFQPASSAPADIVVAVFQALRLEAPRRLRGVFAAVVTNGSELWCFRDQLGWRALHFHDQPKRLVVASEPKQVIAGAGLSREPNLEVLELLLYGRLVHDSPSTLKGVERVPQATVLTTNVSGGISQQAYWHPENLLETSRIPPEEIGAQFVEVFGTAVGRSLTGQDVVSLSGGIDSPAVAGFAAPLYRASTGRPLPALSTVYPNHPRVDESKYIELVATRLGMELHTFTPNAGPWDNLDFWVTLLDGPTPTLSLDEITEYYQIAHKLGFRNVLGGDVAEAVFNLNRHIIGHLVTRGRFKALATLSRTLHSQGSTWSQLGRFMLSPLIPGRLANWYLHRTGRDFPERIPDWLHAAKVNEVPFRRDLMHPGRDRWSAVQLRPYSGSSLTLEAGEVAALVNGMTTRSPFADVDVIEFFLGLRAELKFPDLGSKTLMRRMLRGRVPDEILDRRDKTVFSDYMMSHINYDVLRKYLMNPSTRMAGVNYARLAERIERRDFKLVDYLWANDLVRIHAFLSQW